MTINFNDELNQHIDVLPNDSSCRYRAIKGEHTLTLHFSLAEHIEIPVGASVEHENERYELEQPANFKKNNTRNFEYTLVMEAAQGRLKRYIFRNSNDNRLEFTMTDTPRSHVEMVVDNLNLRESGWEVGECIETMNKPLAFSHTTCFDALSQIANAFETEFEIDRQVIHLRKIEHNANSPLPLSYGCGNGFRPGVGRSNFGDAKPVEKLYVQGGERNIDNKKYGSAKLLLPQNATLGFDGTNFEGEPNFVAAMARIYVSDPTGTFITREGNESISCVEQSLDLSHIYPSRVGTVSGVTVVDAATNKCDFVDNTIPQELNFNDYRIDDEVMSVIFQSGELAGREFDVNYAHTPRRFEIIAKEHDEIMMPDETFKPAVGDTYAIFGVAVPDAYIVNNPTKTGGSWELFREAARYFYNNEGEKFSFTGELDGIWAKDNWADLSGRLKLGGYVLFSDEQFQKQGIAIRIVGIKDYINNPHSPEIELSNETVGSSFMSRLQKIDQVEFAVDDKYQKSVQFTKRRFRDSQETVAALSAAMEDNFATFTGSINPVTANTMSLLVGNESLQFQFVKPHGTTPAETFSIAYDTQTQKLTVSGNDPTGFCRLQHMTLDVKTISPAHQESDYRFWVLRDFESEYLGGEALVSKALYLYARCRMEGATSMSDHDSFILRDVPQPYTSDEGYYHFLLGILNSERGGDRSFVSLYGYTEILPGRITTERIVSSDGETYFDLKEGRIGGRIEFAAGSSGLENLPEWQEQQEQIDQAQATADAATTAIDRMNDDTFFDLIEKQSMRTLWENINGVSDLAAEGTSGSYYTTLQLIAGGGAQVEAFTLADNEQFMVQKQ